MTKTKNTYKENISELHGNMVISYEEGDRLGSVGDIYFDKHSCGIKGISLASKLLEPEEANFIKFKDILKLGNSVVIISKKSAIGSLPTGIENDRLRVLKNIRIVTQEGENLGVMTDVTVNTESGVIHEIALLGDKKVRIDVEKDKIQIGPDMIVVPAEYKSRITHHTKQAEDKLGNVVKSAGEATRRFADSITDSFNEAMNKVTGATKPESGNSETKPDSQPKVESKTTNNASGGSTGDSPKESPAQKAAKKKTVKKASTKKAAAKKAPAKKAAAKKKDDQPTKS